MKEGYQVISPPVNIQLTHHRFSEDDYKTIVGTIESLQGFVDGILLDERIPDPVLATFRHVDVKPMVLLDRTTKLAFDSVTSDHGQGVEKLLDLSLKMGYERFIICSPERNENDITAMQTLKKLITEKRCAKDLQVIEN